MSLRMPPGLGGPGRVRRPRRAVAPRALHRRRLATPDTILGWHSPPRAPTMDLPQPNRTTTDRRRYRRLGGADGAREPTLGIRADPGRVAQARLPGRRLDDSILPGAGVHRRPKAMVSQADSPAQSVRPDRAQGLSRRLTTVTSLRLYTSKQSVSTQSCCAGATSPSPRPRRPASNGLPGQTTKMTTGSVGAGRQRQQRCCPGPTDATPSTRHATRCCQRRFCVSERGARASPDHQVVEPGDVR